MNEFRHLSEFFQDDTALIKEIFELLNSILDFDFGGIFFNSTDTKEPKILNFYQNNCKVNSELFEIIMKDFFKKLFPRDNDYYYNYKISGTISDYTKEVIDYEEFQSTFVIPLISGRQILGGICLYSKERNNYAELKTFNIILDELKLLMRLRWLYSETKLLTIIDPLTSLYNRRYFNEILHREYLRAQRTQANFSIAIFDIDDFKKVNDTYGHQIGDIVLMETSKLILSLIRTTDFAFRYGGEELIILLPDSSIESALVPIERIRKKISEKYYEANNGETFRATVSIGLVSNDLIANNPEDLITFADSALYKSKSLGKNQIQIYEPEQK
jgi:diguanylate cyclase (GGDEF)-like protein